MSLQYNLIKYDLIKGVNVDEIVGNVLFKKRVVKLMETNNCSKIVVNNVNDYVFMLMNNGKAQFVKEILDKICDKKLRSYDYVANSVGDIFEQFKADMSHINKYCKHCKELLKKSMYDKFCCSIIGRYNKKFSIDDITSLKMVDKFFGETNLDNVIEKMVKYDTYYIDVVKYIDDNINDIEKIKYALYTIKYIINKKQFLEEYKVSLSKRQIHENDKKIIIMINTLFCFLFTDLLKEISILANVMI